MTVQPERCSDFEAHWAEVAAAIVGTPGNVRQSLLRSRQPGAYLIVSDWRDRAEFQTFERSPEQDRLTRPLRAHLVPGSPVEMAIDEYVLNLENNNGNGVS
jgi:heme-degrading monooxygenase HmoA